MTQDRKKPLRGKVILAGCIECVTGLHIGSSRDNLDIGGLDLPVLRNPVSREPYIPGSSLKGKLRSLFERRRGMTYNRHSGQGVYRHECVNPACPVCRLFGAAGGREGDNLPARLIVRDCFLMPESEKQLAAIDTGLQYTELKFENALDRVTAAANPRQLERVPAGAQFEFEIIYNVEALLPKETEEEQETRQDLIHLLETMSLLEDDYLGGHGSRGYGRVHFNLNVLTGRTIDFYGATTAAEQERTSTTVQVKTVSECKEKLPDVLRRFL